MTLLWLCAGLAVLAAGNIWMKKGILAVVGRACFPTLACSVMAVLLSGGYGIVLAASAAVQRQSAFLLMALMASSVYYAVLAGTVSAMIRPAPVQTAVWKRECLMTAVCLVCVIIAGRKTFEAGHPDAAMGKICGIVFLAIMFVEIFFMLASSMTGYRRFRRERPLPIIPAFLLAAAGLVMMVCAGLVIAEAAEHFAGLHNIHPAVCGLATGVAAGLLRIPALLREVKRGGTRTMSVLWGPASLMLSGGLGAACMIMSVTISYTVEMAAVFALILLVMYVVCGIPRKKTGRVQAIVIMVVCGEMAMWLLMRLAQGLY